MKSGLIHVALVSRIDIIDSTMLGEDENTRTMDHSPVQLHFARIKDSRE